MHNIFFSCTITVVYRIFASHKSIKCQALWWQSWVANLSMQCSITILHTNNTQTMQYTVILTNLEPPVKLKHGTMHALRYFHTSLNIKSTHWKWNHCGWVSTKYRHYINLQFLAKTNKQTTKQTNKQTKNRIPNWYFPYQLWWCMQGTKGHAYKLCMSNWFTTYCVKVKCFMYTAKYIMKVLLCLWN